MESLWVELASYAWEQGLGASFLGLFCFTSDLETSLGLLVQRLVPSCFVIFDLEPLSLSFDFVFASEIFKSLSFSLDRLCHLIQRISLTGFPAQSVGSSNTDVLDLPCLLVLITGMSQSRQHGKSESDSYYLID
ncbi:hypothetical protein Tco_0840164 [Tanacetum coccineum]|uniref:Uncharacterized protein n=1 Tax=Tanacetum coccineum TaxID=301880 RepID=A0ABQ5AV79_9ASTR